MTLTVVFFHIGDDGYFRSAIVNEIKKILFNTFHMQVGAKHLLKIIENYCEQ